MLRLTALAVALLQLAASASSAGSAAGAKDANAAAAAALSSSIQPAGPQYTVNVKPATTAKVTQVQAAGKGVVSTQDGTGREYVCELPPSEADAAAAKAKAKADAAAAAASGAAADKAAAAAASAPGAAPATTLVNNAIAGLRGACVTKKTGWWTYELCHFGDLKQYHEEGGKIDAVQNWKLGTVAPPANLGVFSPAASTVTNGVTMHTRARVVHPFVNGKICDETKKPRGGEVHYECRGTATVNARPAIIDILEPSTCFYHISVHVPALCNIPDFKPPTSAMPDSSESPAAVARLYRERCFYRSEGWWTYEFCVNKHVRQFRQQPGKNSLPGAADPDSADFYLGHVAAQVRAKLPYEPKLHAKNPRRSYAFAAYTGGSGCDLVDQKRETEVRILCATDAQDRIVSVQEVALCQYRLVFASQKICELDDFAAAEEKLKEIVCYYADDEEAAEVEAAEKETAAAEAAAKVKKAQMPPPTPPRPPPTPPVVHHKPVVPAAAQPAAATPATGAAGDCANVMQRTCGEWRGKGDRCLQCLTEFEVQLNQAGCKPAELTSYCQNPGEMAKKTAAKVNAGVAAQAARQHPPPPTTVQPHDPVAKERQER